MRRSSLLLFSALFVLSFSCENEPVGSFIDETAVDHFIYYGTPDTTQAHQAVVLLYDSRTGSMCTGTLITPTWVLTAAHCLDRVSSMDVYFGNNQNTFYAQRSSAQLIKHPSYSSQSLVADIGLVRLSSAAPNTVTPIPPLPASLAITNNDLNTMLEFVGFGVTETGGSGVKLTVDQRLRNQCSSTSQCNISNSPYQLPPGTISYGQSGGGPCSGDSGGPAFLWRNNVEYVAGVTSYGDPNCTQYGVSTKVDHYMTWITGYTGEIAAEICDNGIDDNGNGLTDCADPACASAPNCQVSACEQLFSISCGQVAQGTTVGGGSMFTQYGSCTPDWTLTGPEVAFRIKPGVGQEVTLHLTMGSSNQDLDMFLMKNSCGNSGCIASSTNQPGQAETIQFTSDGSTYYLLVDTFQNPGNFTLSMNCTGGIPVEICDNGLDDDGDGVADCADADCFHHPACTGRIEICDNGYDDDGDGLVDCDDPDCIGFSACGHSGREICNNGMDDNGNGKVDCNDPQCLGHRDCPIPMEICDNGVDDDWDGLIDCLDADCRTFAGCEQPGMEICNNGMDDNGNGKVDCADPSCQSFHLCFARPQAQDDGCSCTVGRVSGRRTGLFLLFPVFFFFLVRRFRLVAPA